MFSVSFQHSDNKMLLENYAKRRTAMTNKKYICALIKLDLSSFLDLSFKVSLSSSDLEA